MAASSTGARLLLGVLSDYLSKYVCRVWLLVVVIVVGVAGQMSETSAILNACRTGHVHYLPNNRGVDLGN